MRYIFGILTLMLFASSGFAKQVNNQLCEEIWAKGEIIHDFDELEVAGGNYRPRSYIRYKGAMYYGILTIESSKVDKTNIWVAMNCWDSKRDK